VDAGHYGGFAAGQPTRWEGNLRGCEHDATDLQTVARDQGFTASALLGEAATVDAVSTGVTEAAASLKAGDLFVVTFSGYGGQVPDGNSEEHWYEHTWALYDRQLPEDELASLLTSFLSNVRVLVLDDSSSSGTVRRDVSSVEALFGEPPTRALPAGIAMDTYRSNSAVYDGIQSAHVSGDRAAIQAGVIVITGFGENQLAGEGPRNGVFTDALLRVWDDGRFQGDYERFIQKVAALMPPTQIPQLTVRGSGAPFLSERPLTI
jgi:hypothetical protein